MAKIPKGVGRGTMIEIPGGVEGDTTFLRIEQFKGEDDTLTLGSVVYLQTPQKWAFALQTSTLTTMVQVAPLGRALAMREQGTQMPLAACIQLARPPQASKEAAP